MSFISVVSKILPVILLIILGGILRRYHFLKQTTIDEMKKIVVNIALPALLFFAFADTRFEMRYLMIFLAVFLTCGIMLVIGIMLKKVFKPNNRYFPSLFCGFETGMMGYSIYVAVFGPENMDKLAIVDLGQVTFVFFVLVTYLQRQNGQKAPIRATVQSFVKSPVILAIATGIVVGIAGIMKYLKAFDLSNSFMESLNLLSELTAPIICMIIGYELHLDLKNLKKPFLSVVVRMGIHMGIAVLINELLLERVMQLHSSYKIALYTLYLLPPPFVIPIFMKDQEKNKQYILNVISLHIILSLFAFLLLIAFL